VPRDVLEETVLGALRSRLMDPKLFRISVSEFIAEWNRLQAEAAARSWSGCGGGSGSYTRRVNC
jgi:hypothetical protein